MHPVVIGNSKLTRARISGDPPRLGPAQYVVIGILLQGGLCVEMQTADLAKARRKVKQIGRRGPFFSAFIVRAVK